MERGKYIRTKEWRINNGLIHKGQVAWNKDKTDLYLGDKNSFYGKKHTNETRKKMSQSHADFSGKKHPRWKGGIPKCKLCTKTLSRYGSKTCMECRFKLKKPTSIEKKVYDFLVLKGIVFEKQHVVNGRFVVDAYIPSLNLVIEADGTYWHNMENMKRKDKAENAYLAKCGYKMVRLSEDEINSGEFKERLKI